MSRLNTMYPDDEFLKNISDMMGKLDNKNETEIKQEIEQIGYKEFYRYYKEKNVYIKQLKEENKQLKMINKEYERLNKEKNRGFKITNVQEYNIDKLLSYKKYKDNWNKLKDYIVKEYYMYLPLEASAKSITILIDKMEELEQGSDSNG